MKGVRPSNNAENIDATTAVYGTTLGIYSSSSSSAEKLLMIPISGRKKRARRLHCCTTVCLSVSVSLSSTA